jgi:2-polyprenyl-3-methyl-5-hydroxy-6-metoxy-1,4-benzoquinol methylase
MTPITQEEITDYFKQGLEYHNNRHANLSKWQYSGYSLLDKISPDESVIDVGCGQNLFKSYLPYLVGVDPATDQADYKIPILEFETDQQFDVALCLGSVNFGDIDNIRAHVDKINSLLKPTGRIYWRCNEKSWLPDWFFKWTFDLHQELADKFGYELRDCKWDYFTPDDDHSYRIYAEWIRKL